MAELVDVLLPFVLSLQMFGIACLVVGWLLAGEVQHIEPADTFDAVEEETTDEPVIKPELAWWFTTETEPVPVFDSLGLSSARTHRRTVSCPVPAPDELKDDTTRPIRVNRPWSRTSYLHDDGQHRTPESLLRTPDFTAELPEVTSSRLDWSSHPTASVPEVQVGRHRSGEYPMVEVSG